MKFQNEFLKVITLKSSADAEVLATPHYSASAFLSNLIFVTEIQKSTKVYFPDCYETRLFNQTLAIRNRAPIDTRVRNRGRYEKYRLNLKVRELRAFLFS